MPTDTRRRAAGRTIEFGLRWLPAGYRACDTGMALYEGAGPRQQPQERMISFSHGARRGPPAVDTSRGRSSAGRSLLELADQDLGGVDEHAQRGSEVALSTAGNSIVRASHGKL